jgi:hypothetical protein
MPIPLRRRGEVLFRDLHCEHGPAETFVTTHRFPVNIATKEVVNLISQPLREVFTDSLVLAVGHDEIPRSLFPAVNPAGVRIPRLEGKPVGVGESVNVQRCGSDLGPRDKIKLDHFNLHRTGKRSHGAHP